MIDSHAHPHDEAFAEDRAAMWTRAQAAGIRDLIAVGTDLATSAAAIAFAEEHGTAAAIGVHPHEAETAPADLAGAFAALRARARRCVAIGEIGLDYYYEHSPRERQREVLREQLRIAADLDLPVIFHERDAFEDFVAILREEAARRAACGAPRLRGVVHCFTRDLSAGRVYVEEFGLYLGIGGVLTFKNAQALRDAVRALGVAPLLLETDAPYLAPVPLRGKRNESAYLPHAAAKLAEVLGIPVDDVIARTTANCGTLFGMTAAA